MSGTLDGYIDFAIFFQTGHVRTQQINPDEALDLASRLLSAANDVHKNCLFDRDALLSRPLNTDAGETE
jgi:hypothetical protein